MAILTSSRMKKSNINLKKSICPERLSNKIHEGDHKWNKSKLIQNLNKITNDSDPKVKEQVASNLIKNIRETNSPKNTNGDNTVIISQNRGKGMKIVINPSTPKTRASVITANDVNKISMNCGLSTNKTLELVKNMRSALNNRKLFEPNLRNNLKSINHNLDSFFDFKKCEFTTSKSETTNVEQPVVFCNNLDKLVENIMKKRNYENENVMLKFTIDGGGGFLKICLSIQLATEQEDRLTNNSRKRLNDGIVSKNFIDSGINKILLIGLASNVEKNYKNVSVLWELLKIRNFKGFVSTDIKLANILCGLMSSASCYPCT